MHRVPLLPALLLLSAACGSGDRINAPVPVGRGGVVEDTAVALLPSVVNVPVSYDLGPALEWLEGVIPRRLGDLEERIPVPDNSRFSFAFLADRTPFRLRLDGNSATLSATINYGGRGWYDPPLLPAISGSCGIKEERPRVRLTVRSSVSASNDWKIRSRSRVIELRPLTAEPRDRCTVTVAEINVTDRVLVAVRQVLERELRVVDRELAGFDLRERVEDIWNFLSAPIQLQDSLWLVMDPAAIRLDTIRGEGRTLHSSVGVTAYPRVIGGAEPVVQPRPLPELDRSRAPAGLSLLSEAVVNWDVLTSILRRELAGDTIQVAGRSLVIHDIAVSGLEDGRAVVGLEIRGAARGKVYVVGTPAFDTTDATLTMPDAEFDVNSRSLMVKGLAWLADGQVEERIRNDLRLSLAGILEDGRALLAREMTRELAPGVRIATRVDHGQVVRVRARPTALTVDVVVGGATELQLTLAPGQSVSRTAQGAAPR